MAAKVWFNPCRLGSRGHLGADFSLLLYTELIKKRKPSEILLLLLYTYTESSTLIGPLLPCNNSTPIIPPLSAHAVN